MQLNTLSMVHDFLKRSVQPGAFCIDATAGKGRDTALLCRLAGETGRVLAFDVQPEAVVQTKALLTAEFVRKIKQYEPRVRVMRVEWTQNHARDGGIVPKVVVSFV